MKHSNRKRSFGVEVLRGLGWLHQFTSRVLLNDPETINLHFVSIWPPGCPRGLDRFGEPSQDSSSSKGGTFTIKF
jgi:hypothetical protein